MSWFEKWFGTRYYQLLYANRNEEEAKKFIDNILVQVVLEEGASVTDACCGTGRHSKLFSEKGFRVTGLDLNPDAIACAKECQYGNLSFLVHDVRKKFPVSRQKMIVNLFTSFGYSEDEKDDRTVLRNIYDALDDEGFFLMDFLNADFLRKNLVMHEEKELCNIRFLIRRHIEKGFVKKYINIYDGEIEECYTEQVKLIPANTLIEYLTQTGFIIKKIYGSYALEPFNASSSERVIFIALKPRL